MALGPVYIWQVVATSARLGVLLSARIITSWLPASESSCSKLAAHQHHGRAPAASWFQVNTSKRPFVMAQTLSWLQRCFGDPLVAYISVLKLILFQSKAAATHNDTSLVDSKFKNAHTRNGTAYVIRPCSLAYIIWTMVRWCISRIILPLTSVIRSLQLDIPLAWGLGYIYCKLPLTLVSGSIFAIYTSLPCFIYCINPLLLTQALCSVANSILRPC